MTWIFRHLPYYINLTDSDCKLLCKIPPKAQCQLIRLLNDKWRVRKDKWRHPDHGNCNSLFLKAHDNASRRFAPWSGIKNPAPDQSAKKQSSVWVHKWPKSRKELSCNTMKHWVTNALLYTQNVSEGLPEKNVLWHIFCAIF